MNWAEACRILGVKETASPEEIDERYHTLGYLLHPDANVGKPKSAIEAGLKEFLLVKQAHDFLKNSSNNPHTNPPKVKVSPQRIRFKDVETEQRKKTTFEISSVGGPYTSIWFDREPSPWLSVVGFKPLINGEQLPLEVEIECIGTGEVGEQLRCSLAVRLENENTQIKDEVTIEIELGMKVDPPILKVDDTVITVDSIVTGTIEHESFYVNNIGHGFLQGKITTTKPWISVSPDTLNLPANKTCACTVNISTYNLSLGYSDRGTISIRTNGGDADIPVELSIARLATTAVKETISAKNNYSISKFVKSFFWILIFPFIPPMLIVTIFLLQYWQEPLFWFGVGIYALMDIIISDNKAKKVDKKATYPSTYTPTYTKSTTAYSKPVSKTYTHTVIVNSFSRIYHRPSCEWAKKSPVAMR